MSSNTQLSSPWKSLSTQKYRPVQISAGKPTSLSVSAIFLSTSKQILGYQLKSCPSPWTSFPVYCSPSPNHKTLYIAPDSIAKERDYKHILTDMVVCDATAPKYTLHYQDRCEHLLSNGSISAPATTNTDRIVSITRQRLGEQLLSLQRMLTKVIPVTT
jgi:hypothetical protein